MNKHDPYCKCYYPALTDPDTCTWCYVIKEVRKDEYLEAWNEGFGIGYGEGYEKAREQMTLNKYNNTMSENEDIAYWQGYNNAMLEISEASAAGTSTPSAHTIEELLLHNMFDGDRGGLVTMSVDVLIKEVAKLLSDVDMDNDAENND